MAAILVVQSTRNTEIVNRSQDSHTSFLLSNNSLCLLVSEENICLISASQRQEFPIAAMFFFLGNLLEHLPLMLPVKFRFIWPSGLR